MPWYNNKFFFERDRINISEQRFNAMPPPLIDASHVLVVDPGTLEVMTVDISGGLQGPVGPIGPIGPIGPAGPAGNDGAQGPAGPIGPDGAIGPAGADGAQGPAGPIGPDGAIGPAGPIGPDGAVGPAGPAGPAGADGDDFQIKFAVGTNKWEEAKPERRTKFAGSTNAYSIGKVTFLPGGNSRSTASLNFFPTVLYNGGEVQCNQHGFARTKDICWNEITPAVPDRPPPGTEAIIPIYWFNKNVLAATQGNLIITQGLGLAASSGVTVWERNLIFQEEYESIELRPISVLLTVTVDPLPSGSNSNIEINVRHTTSGATNRFSVTPSTIVLNSSNNFSREFIVSATMQAGTQPTSQGTINFYTQVIDTAHPAYDTYHDIQYSNVPVTVYDLGERIIDIPNEDLPPNENVAFTSNGYYPLYRSVAGANNASLAAGNYPGQFIEIEASSDLGNYSYYMPVGVPRYFGNYVSPTPPNNNNDILNNNNITPIIQP